MQYLNTTTRCQIGGLKNLIRDVQSDDEDDVSDVPAAADLDPSKPWSTDFKMYINTLRW